MSHSWGHTVRDLGPEERLQHAKCSAPLCGNPPAYLCTYFYVSGRAGRATSSQRQYCEPHATKWANQHGLDL